jgi:hypothetical protein
MSYFYTRECTQALKLFTYKWKGLAMQDSYNVIRHQLHSIRVVIRHHYAKRHVYGSAPAREWITHFRRIRASSAFFESINFKG